MPITFFLLPVGVENFAVSLFLIFFSVMRRHDIIVRRK